MRHRKIPSELQSRIEEYLDYLWTTQKGLDESSITDMLPATLQQQLSLFCNSRIISTVPLFADVPSHICAAIVMQLQPRIFVPDDMIITQGDWADEMFLIFRGNVLWDKNTLETCRISDGCIVHCVLNPKEYLEAAKVSTEVHQWNVWAHTSDARRLRSL